MNSIQDLTDRLAAALRNDPAGTQSLKIDLGEAGVIRAEGYDVTNTDEPADCTLTISKADLDAVLAGELDMVAAANDGRLGIEGDVSAAIAMQQVLISAWLPAR